MRDVCGHTNHRATMIHTFLESPCSLDVYPRIRFSILAELASKSTLYGYVMLTKGSNASRLRPDQSSRNDDSYIFGKPNRPRYASQEAFCSFWPKSSKLTSPKQVPKTTKFGHVAPDRRGSSPVDDNFFCSFFNILVCNALCFPSRAQISRNRAKKLTYKSAKYRVCLLLCLDPGGVHCVTFADTPIIAQQCFIHFWKA